MPQLPWWAGWTAPIGFAVLAFVLALAALTLAAAVALGCRRGWDGLPWTERARRAYGARMALVIGAAVLTPSLIWIADWHSGPLSVGGTHGGMLLAGLAGALAVFLAHVRLERAVRARRVTAGERLRGLGILAVIMYPHWILGIAAAMAAPPRLGTGYAITLLVTAAIFVAIAFDWNLGLACLLGWARPAGERAEAVMAAAAARAGLPKPRLYELRWDLWQALALPERGMVMVTNTALARLDDTELEAIFAHELAHLAEPAAVRRRRLLASAIPFLLVLGMPLAAFEPWAPMWVFLIVWALALWHRRWCRRHEARADAGAGAHEPVPGAFAHGLAKGYEANLLPAVIGAKALTHPELYDRMVATGFAPDYPRPAPPSKARMLLGLVVGVMLVVLALRLVESGLGAAAAAVPAERQLLWTAAAYGGSSEQLLVLAHGRLSARDTAGALALARMVPADDSQAPEATALIAIAVARSGDCASAEAWFERSHAQHLAAGRDPNQCDWISRSSAEVQICRRRPRWQAEGLLPEPSTQLADPDGDATAE